MYLCAVLLLTGTKLSKTAVCWGVRSPWATKRGWQKHQATIQVSTIITNNYIQAKICFPNCIVKIFPLTMNLQRKSFKCYETESWYRARSMVKITGSGRNTNPILKTLLAPSGALVVIMVYYIPTAQTSHSTSNPVFQIFLILQILK